MKGANCERIRQIRERRGERLSFTGFIAYCCARAVDEEKHVHAYGDWRNRLVIFDDVEVSLGVERRGQGQPVVLQGIIRAENRKSAQEIHDEIRELQTKELAETPWGRWLGSYVLIPAFLRRLLFRIAQGVPKAVKSVNGTVLITAVGMFGNTAG